MPALSPSQLADLAPQCAFFVGVDSDGCVFDSMGVKQRGHFHPLICRHWGLEALDRELLRAVEFVNLGSKWRGQNRFPCLLRVFETLAAMPGVRESGVTLPRVEALRAYCASGLPLGNPSLAAEVERTGDPELRRLLAWSLEVNRDIAARMRLPAPFPGARLGLERLAERCDVLVVSQTPAEALAREWRAAGLERLVRGIAGQEAGSKAQLLRLAAGGRYAPGRMLLLGDAPGDAAAAREAGALFYPIVPGREAESWERFHAEALDRFLAGTYAGAYAGALFVAFERSLPDTPPWAAVPPVPARESDA